MIFHGVFCFWGRPNYLFDYPNQILAPLACARSLAVTGWLLDWLVQIVAKTMFLGGGMQVAKTVVGQIRTVGKHRIASGVQISPWFLSPSRCLAVDYRANFPLAAILS